MIAYIAIMHACIIIRSENHMEPAQLPNIFGYNTFHKLKLSMLSKVDYLHVNIYKHSTCTAYENL